MSFRSRTGITLYSNKYSDAEPIGGGSYAIVYAATVTANHEQHVAVKVIDLEGRGLFTNLVEAKRELREVCFVLIIGNCCLVAACLKKRH